MAYLGTKDGNQRLAKQHREQAILNRQHALLLDGDVELPNEAARLRAAADALDAEAEALDPGGFIPTLPPLPKQGVPKPARRRRGA